MALVDQLYIGGVWTSSEVQNNTPAVVSSAVASGSGEAISDTYTLTVSAVSAGTCTITIGTSSPNNPYKGRVVTGVQLDGTTARSDVLPGATIVMNSAAANGNVATIKIGDYIGTFDAFGAGAGVPSAGVRHRVLNNGTGAVSDSKVRLLTQAVMVRQTGNVFAVVRPFADGATEKTTGGGSSRVEPYNMTIHNVAGSGAGKTAELRIDGVAMAAASVMDLSTGTTQNGTGLKAISPSYYYRIVSGALGGVEFAIHPSCGNGDEANILIFPSRFVQIAPDSAGVAGTYGTVDVVLTQAGQSAGIIQPAGEAFYWVRILVPASSNAESNPYPANVALQGTETGSANWLG